MPDFSTIAAVLKEPARKNVKFEWTEKQEIAFQTLKHLLTHAPVLVLPNFGKSFEIECDTSGICNGIGVVLMQEGNQIAYFSGKLSGAVLNYPTYDKKLCML